MKNLPKVFLFVIIPILLASLSLEIYFLQKYGLLDLDPRNLIVKIIKSKQVGIITEYRTIQEVEILDKNTLLKIISSMETSRDRKSINQYVFNIVEKTPAKHYPDQKR